MQAGNHQGLVKVERLTEEGPLIPHLAANGAKAENKRRYTPPGRNRRRRFLEGTIWRAPLRDAVTALAGGILCRLDLLPALATEDADEATNRVLLPARRRHDLRRGGSALPRDQADHCGVLAGAFGAVCPVRMLFKNFGNQVPL